MERKLIDILLVEYNSGCKGICWAPSYAVFDGDLVETEFGRGIILKKVPTFTDEDLYVLITEATQIDKVLGKINVIDYVEEEDAVPEE